RRQRPQRGDRQPGDPGHDPFPRPLLLAVVEVLREVALERAADLPAVGAHALERLLDVLRQQLGRELLLLAGDRPLRPAEDALRPTDGEEGAAGGDTGRLARVCLDLGGDVDGGATGGLEAVDLARQVLARRYDRFESGIRSRAHAIVSFV